jgi:zinc protease
MIAKTRRESLYVSPHAGSKHRSAASSRAGAAGTSWDHGGRRWGWIGALLLLVLSVPPAGAAPAPRRVSLPNGLTVLLAPDSTATAVDVGVWYRAGSRSEPPGKSGTAHLLARLMYRGTRRHPPGDHGRLLQAEGGSIHTLVHPDYSSFSETIPPEALGLALELESDRMRGLRLDAADLEAARSLIRDEQQQSATAGLFERGLERLYATAFRGDPYGRPVTGLPEDLEQVVLADVESFYRKGYAPENAVLVLTGRFDPDRTLALVRKSFGAVPRGTTPSKGKPRPRAGTAAVPEQRGARREAERVASRATALIVGWRTGGYTDPDAAAIEVLSRVLTGGSSARLPRATSAIGATFLHAQGGFERNREAGLIYCMTAVKPGADTAAAEAELVAEVERLASEPPPLAELERARRQLVSETLFGWQSVRMRAQSLGAAQVLGGDHRLADGRLAKLESLTPADIQRAAARVLKAERRSVVWLLSETGSGLEGGRDSGDSR